MTPTCVRAVGQGGGHGGFGGHGGGHGGHSSKGPSAGHSSGHSIGHSFAHIFGHHGHRASPAALKGAAPEHPEVTPSPESVLRVLDRQPKDRFMSRPRIGLVPRRRIFGFGGCPYGWFDNNFRIGDNWNCSNDGFFFDPFFTGCFSDRFPTAQHLAAQHGSKMGRQPTQRLSLQRNQTPRIRAQIWIRQTRHRASAATPRH